MSDSRPPYVLVGGTTEPGGLHVHTADTARALAAAGHPVTIVSTSHDYFSQLVEGSPVAVVQRELPEEGPAVQLYRTWSRALAEFRGPRVIYGRGQGGCSPLAILGALRRHFDRLYTVEHRVPDPRDPPGILDRMRFALAGRMVYRALAVSEDVRQAILQTFFFDPRRIRTCPNWVDGELFHPDPGDAERVRRSIGVGPDSFLVGYVGRLGPEKRVDLLIRGFAEYRRQTRAPSKLAIVGAGWKEAELKQLVRTLALEESVLFSGWRKDASRWHRALDLLVLPSLLEGFPIVLLEGMASGSICLTHPVAGAGACIDHERNGFVTPLDEPAEIACWIDRVASMPVEQRTRIREAARRFVLERFGLRARLADLLLNLDAAEAAEQLLSNPEKSVKRSFEFPEREP